MLKKTHPTIKKVTAIIIHVLYQIILATVTEH